MGKASYGEKPLLILPRSVLLLGLLPVFAFCLPALGQEPDPLPKEVQGILEGLLDDREATRKKALKQVWEIGPDLPGVLEALREGRKKAGEQESVLYLAALAHLDMEDTKSSEELRGDRGAPRTIPVILGARNGLEG